ncbi:MAG: metallophosphoesterase family protein [Anaerolineae bacterium]
MKLAVLSDIHGNLVALEAVLTDVQSVGEVDMVWVLGDLAAFGPRPSECIKRIRTLQEERTKDKCKVIGGNTDRYLVTGERLKTRPAENEDALPGFLSEMQARDMRLNWNLSKLDWEDYDFLKGILGRETSLAVPGYGHVIGYHAVPGDDESMALKPDSPAEEAADALLDREGRMGIGGHTHLQMDRDLGRWRAINVGSVGFSSDMPGRAQWGLFTFEADSVIVNLRAVPYDVEHLMADANDAGYPDLENLKARVQADA